MGYKWEAFGEISGDRAKRIDVGDSEVFCILYETKNIGCFTPRFHLENESIHCLSGDVTVETPFIKSILEKGNMLEIPKSQFKDHGEWHRLIFNKPSRLMIQFY